jgi:L-alanine-DL-glutamate epimerase-like enolase superfamily enzyme
VAIVRPRAEVWRAGVPLAERFGTAIGHFENYEHVVVVIREGTALGWGSAAFLTAATADRSASLAAAMIDECLGQTATARVPDVPLPRVGAGEHRDDIEARHGAASAVELAWWDLAGRQRGVAAAEMWGARRQRVPAYASGFFLSASSRDLVREAEGYVREGFRLAKMRVGRSVDEDVERYRLVAAVIGDSTRVAVDAVQRSTPAEVREFLAHIDGAPLWYEDPVPYARLAEVAGVGAPIAAGESLPDLAALRSLLGGGVASLILLDVKWLGGPRRFLAAARALMADGARVGAHVHTAQSAHLLAALPASLPVEDFRWSDALMVDPPRPLPDGSIAARGPGFGVELSLDALARFGHEVATVG